MAHSAHSHALMAELGGKHLHDRQPLHNTPAGVSKSDQRLAPTADTVPSGTDTTGGRGNGQATSEEASNDDDEEDSSAAQDEQEDDDEEPDTHAPSRGRGKGKGKRPAIRIESADDDESQVEDEPSYRETGLQVAKKPVTNTPVGKKKRTFSTLSNTSVLFGDDESEKHTFPRRKMPRTLSSSSFKPLLKYKENATQGMNGSENAIETDDDEDYSGVNLIPDDEDSELEDIEQQEESFIIQDEEHHTSALINQFNDARRLSLDSLASDNIFDLTAPIEDSYGMNHSDMGFARFFEPPLLPSSPHIAPKRKFSDSSTKRVRFDDEVQMSDSSSTSSSELDSSLYPDLFLDQDKLPASLSQLLETDYDEDNGDYDSPASEMSFWDFGEGDLQQNTHRDAQDFDESSEAGSSGYETDMGDTTDEYESDSDARPETPLQKKSVLRQPPSAPGSRFNSPVAFERNSRTGRAIPPTRGIFIHEDFGKAIAVTNRATKRLTFYRPRAPMISWVPVQGMQSSSTSNANDSPRTSLAQYNNVSDSEADNDMFSNNLSTDIMLTGIFGADPSNDYYFGTDSIGPPEAFYPFVSIGGTGNAMDDDDDGEDEDFEDDLNITDFMDFGSELDDATDVEPEEEETDVPATPAVSTMAMHGSTPAHPTPYTETPSNRKKTTSDAMLQHFDRGVVTAFRNNQNRYRDIAQLPSDPSIRASVSRPVRSGKSAETLMTPLRKRSSRRIAKSPYQQSSPMVNASSPLGGVTKASGRLNSSLLSASRPPRMGTFT